MPEKLFTYFGNKERIAKIVWQLFGTDNRSYVEPFCGCASILLKSPVKHTFECINDIDCYVANAHRATKYNPRQVIKHLYYTRCEIDLWSRHDYLINHKKDFTLQMLREDPKFCNPELAAWWIWGINLWLGGNWCADGSLIRSNGYKVGTGTQKPVRANQGVLSTLSRKPVNANVGILSTMSKKPVSSNKGVLSTKSIKPISGNQGVLSTWSQKPISGNKGVLSTMSQKPVSSNQGVLSTKSESISHIKKLRDRILDVYERLIDTTILCGDWKRCVTHSYTTSFGKCAIFLDPPYPSTNDSAAVYDNNSLDGTVFNECKEYFLKNYHNPNMRIILCGNSGDWEDCPEDVHKIYWKRGAGYAKDKSNREEVLWCSDACLFDNIKEVM